MPRWAAISGTMIRLSTFTPRMWLILAHDLLATAAAVVASFFIRFEEAGLARALAACSSSCSGFVVYAGFVYFLFGLYKAKWRFTSLPDLYNIVRAATVLAVSLLVLDYVLSGAATSTARSSSARSPSSSTGCCRSRSWAVRASPTAISATPARCSTRKAARLDADAGARPRRRCRGAAARDRERRGHEDPAGRHPVAVARPIAARRSAAFRCSATSTTSSSVVADLAKSRHQRHAAGASRRRALGAGSEAGNDPDARAPARACDQPAAVARRRRRGAAACAGRCRGSAAAAEREDRLPPAREFRAAASRSSSPAAAARSARKSATASSPSARRGCW